jgi:hypothetical protein
MSDLCANYRLAHTHFWVLLDEKLMNIPAANQNSSTRWLSNSSKQVMNSFLFELNSIKPDSKLTLWQVLYWRKCAYDKYRLGSRAAIWRGAAGQIATGNERKRACFSLSRLRREI